MLVTQLLECLHDVDMAEAANRAREFIVHSGIPQDTVEDYVRAEQQRMAANQVTIGNVIASMRLISAMDWSHFFERVSQVEDILTGDPAGIYRRMDFATRDQYRHVVEAIAKRLHLSETRVATTAVGLSRDAERAEAADLRLRHVGYYLIDSGRLELERILHYRPTVPESLARTVKRHATSVYLGAIAICACVGPLILGLAAVKHGYPHWVSILAGVTALLPLSELAVGLVNFVVTNSIQPVRLPKIKILEQVPPEFETLVVMPTLLGSERDAQSLLEKLEIHYLTNSELGLRFALLTDFSDAPREEMSEDAGILQYARTGIQSLNARYCKPKEPRFFILHRRRRWNAKERIWMGWERKRGKLIELNRLLRGATDTSYLVSEKDFDGLGQTRFVITLDADTKLPHAAAKKMIGALAHPLNRPQFIPKSGHLDHGYSVLQPRVSVSLASASRSLYARWMSLSPGLDPYCTATSDVYQDMFGEGSYTGKGIYHIDSFAAATDNVFPHNRILSHDLIEGCYAGVGLLTDVEVFDDYPQSVAVDARRQHRWVRGDWQLLPWLFPYVPTPTGRHRNRLPLIARWKLFDNLRRSLVPAGIVGMLILGWFMLPELAWMFSLIALAVIGAPFLFQLLSTVLSLPSSFDWSRNVRDMLKDAAPTLLQCGLSLSLCQRKQ